MSALCTHCRIQLESVDTSIFQKKRPLHRLILAVQGSGQWKEIVPDSGMPDRFIREMKILCPFCAAQFRLKLERDELDRHAIAGLIGLGIIFLMLFAFVFGG